jgi:hypothetical protein
MILKENSIELFGEAVGYVLAYFTFTTALFLVLTLLDRIPPSWSYTHVMAAAFLLNVAGAVVGRLLR